MKVQDAQKTLAAVLHNKEAEAKHGTSAQKTEVSEQTAPTSGSARVNISEESRGAQKAAEIVRNTPNVRWEKVQALKQKMEAGEYQIDNKEVAGKLIRELVSDLIR